ncbi:MAG: cytochrome c oxidase assembly protein [Gemmatimonadota bacterium]
MDATALQAPTFGELLTDWTVYPSFLIGWALFGAAYAAAVGPLRRRYGWAERVQARHPLTFLAGLAVLFLALQGPLHDLSDRYLFSAHMVQHLVLTLAVPPLLLAGVPPWLAQAALRVGAMRRAVRALTRPLVAFALYNVVFTFWHVPAFYDLMMRHHDVHIAMHLSILATAVVLWWPVAAPVAEPGRLGYGPQILYLFLLGIPMMALAAIITLAEGRLYPWYGPAPRLWGLTPLQDEQLGGLIMWVPGSMALWAAITVVFFRWSAQKEDRTSGSAVAGPAGAERRR